MIPKVVPGKKGGYVHYMEKIDGKKIRERSEKFKDHFSQASSFYNSMSEIEKNHILKAFHFEIGKVETEDIRKRIVEQFANVDKELAVKIAEGVGVKPPSNGTDSTKSDNFPSFSMEDTIKNTIKSRQIAILVDNGFNYKQLKKVQESIEKANASSKIISMYLGKIKSSNGKEIEVDQNFISSTSTIFDAVFIPGGSESIKSLKGKDSVIRFINEAFKHCKTIGALNKGIELLNESDIKSIKTAKTESDGIKSDYGIITAKTNKDIDNFSKSFIDSIAKHRHWDRELDGLV